MRVHFISDKGHFISRDYKEISVWILTQRALKMSSRKKRVVCYQEDYMGKETELPWVEREDFAPELTWKKKKNIIRNSVTHK